MLHRRVPDGDGAILGDSGTPGDLDAAFACISVAGLLSGAVMWALCRPPLAATHATAVTTDSLAPIR